MQIRNLHEDLNTITLGPDAKILDISSWYVPNLRVEDSEEKPGETSSAGKTLGFAVARLQNCDLKVFSQL
jgi:hypothetical protein